MPKWLNVSSASAKGPLVSSPSLAPTQYARHKAHEPGFVRSTQPDKRVPPCGHCRQDSEHSSVLLKFSAHSIHLLDQGVNCCSKKKAAFVAQKLDT